MPYFLYKLLEDLCSNSSSRIDLCKIDGLLELLFSFWDILVALLLYFRRMILYDGLGRSLLMWSDTVCLVVLVLLFRNLFMFVATFLFSSIPRHFPSRPGCLVVTAFVVGVIIVWFEIDFNTLRHCKFEAAWQSLKISSFSGNIFFRSNSSFRWALVARYCGRRMS